MLLLFFLLYVEFVTVSIDTKVGQNSPDSCGTSGAYTRTYVAKETSGGMLWLS